MNAPHKIDTTTATPQLTDDCCDLCCATPVRIVLDGDKLCQECADKWARNERPDGDDLLPLAHPAMQAAIARYQQVVRDAELERLSRGQRKFERDFGCEPARVLKERRA
jgi:hypothetical protein